MSLVVLEVLSIRVRCGDEAHAVLVVDDAEAGRAFRVHVTYNASEESFERIEVATWWSDNLVEHAVPAFAVKLIAAVRRLVECDAELRERLACAVCDVGSDAAIYDHVTSEGRV